MADADPSAILAGIRERYQPAPQGSEAFAQAIRAAEDIPRLAVALEAALKLHQGVTDGDYPESRALCDEDGEDAPCPTVRVITAALAGKGEGDGN